MAYTPCNGNAMLVTDSYKVTHNQQYPPNTKTVFSYFECRGGKFKESCFFGLQYIIKNWLSGVVVTEEKIVEAKDYLDKHFGPGVFNEAGWRYILEKHGGKLPMRIRAVPEGTVVPVKNVLFTVENTDPECFWLVTWFETILVQAWYPITVCTNSREQKKILRKYLDATAESSDGIGFKLHDFGFRGVSSAETAGIGGAAHLVNFMGTDTLAALTVARDVYGLSKDTVAGFSIPASEHSTITSWGKNEELGAFTNMLDKFPTGLVACVSDSFNIWEACTKLWGGTLKDKVSGRKGTLVVRPDSGHPPEVVVKCLELLGSKFGTSMNSKGYKMLPDFIRLIQGDGIDAEMLESCLAHMAAFGWSADNLAFGSGGGLLQKLNRDTMKCAYKCSWVKVGDEARDVSKDPITDRGKKSKRGRLTLEDVNGTLTTMENGDPAKDVLTTVFENGELTVDQSFEDVRKRAEVSEQGPLQPFQSSEGWVKEFDNWAKEMGLEIVSKASLYKPSSSVADALKTVGGDIGKNLTKEEVEEALKELTAVNEKLTALAKKF
eukprot:m.36846 g.36846  ORF g.36846 m.36846 type:complete len:549 (+) comp9192_c0_seq2:113-1759(+)